MSISNRLVPKTGIYGYCLITLTNKFDFCIETYFWPFKDTRTSSSLYYIFTRQPFEAFSLPYFCIRGFSLIEGEGILSHISTGKKANSNSMTYNMFFYLEMRRQRCWDYLRYFLTSSSQSGTSKKPFHGENKQTLTITCHLFSWKSKFSFF